MVLISIILAVVIVSAISLVGVLYLALRPETLKKLLTVLVAFAAGTLLAAAFLDLIPESFESLNTLIPVLAGILLFFGVETVLHWHHHNDDCHDKKECMKVHPVVSLNIIGDALHNFMDGIIIAASFLAGTSVGIITTIAIALHEIPQEIGDYAILVHGGLTRKKALIFNFLTALTAIIGGIMGYYFLSGLEGIIPYIIGIAGGGFLYIATADLLPELHKEKNWKKIIRQTIALLIGIALIWLMIGAFPE